MITLHTPETLNNFHGSHRENYNFQNGFFLMPVVVNPLSIKYYRVNANGDRTTIIFLDDKSLPVVETVDEITNLINGTTSVSARRPGRPAKVKENE